VPDGSIWDMCERFADVAAHVVRVPSRLASDAPRFCGDDTGATILDARSMDSLRPSSMGDCVSSNVITAAVVMYAGCNAHAVRRFKALADRYPEQAGWCWSTTGRSTRTRTSAARRAWWVRRVVTITSSTAGRTCGRPASWARTSSRRGRWSRTAIWPRRSRTRKRTSADSRRSRGTGCTAGQQPLRQGTQALHPAAGQGAGLQEHDRVGRGGQYPHARGTGTAAGVNLSEYCAAMLRNRTEVRAHP